VTRRCLRSEQSHQHKATAASAERIQESISALRALLAQAEGKLQVTHWRMQQVCVCVCVYVCLCMCADVCVCVCV
jgi:hypothetical protein